MNELPTHVKNSETFCLFLTKQVFERSDLCSVCGLECHVFFLRFWIVEEVKSAEKNKVDILLVRETDSRHGALSLNTLQQQCPSELREPVFEAEVVDWHRGRCLARQNAA